MKSSLPIKRAPGFLLQAAPWVVALVTLLVTGVWWKSAQDAISRDLLLNFYFQVREIHSLITQRLQAYEQVLRGTQGLFLVVKDVSRLDFQTYIAAQRISYHYPGIQGVGFSLIVPPDKLQDHIASIRKEGYPNFSVRPEGPREIYTSIIYLEPFTDRNLRAFGYDMYSEEIRRSALERARDTGDAIITAKVTLLQENDANVQAGFVMYLPVYKKEALLFNINQRRKNIIGWVYAPFRMNDFMAHLQGPQPEDLSIEIYDGRKISDETRMFCSNEGKPVPQGGFMDSEALNINGHAWTVVVRSLPDFVARANPSKPLWIVAGGLTLGFLLAFTVWLLVNAQKRALALAEVISGELESRSNELVEAKVRTEMQQKEAELAYTRGLYESASGYLHNVGNAITRMESHVLDLETVAKSTTQYPEVFRKLEEGGEAFAPTLQRFKTVLLDKTIPLITATVAGITQIKDSIKQTISHQQAGFRSANRQMPEVFSLSALLADVCAHYQRGNLTLDIAPGIEICNYREPLRQGIENLVKNALEAIGPAGHVQVSCRQVPDGAEVLVQDDGHGVSPEKLPSLMKAGFTTKPTGNGLGLHSFAIFLSAANGRLAVESDGLGKGTRVKATISNAK
jgi:CHASE1-domain containing sensor protein